MRGPQISVTCECSTSTWLAYGQRWTCPNCGKVWDTSQIPADDYDRLIRSIRRYRLLTLGPPVALAAVLVPLSVFAGVQFAFLLFILLLAWGLLVMPQLKTRASASVLQHAKTWKLHPE